MAPEQLEKRKYSMKSDVWSFGCLMFEAYARKKPWDGYTNAAAVHKVLSQVQGVLCFVNRTCADV